MNSDFRHYRSMQMKINQTTSLTQPASKNRPQWVIAYRHQQLAHGSIQGQCTMIAHTSQTQQG